MTFSLLNSSILWLYEPFSVKWRTCQDRFLGHFRVLCASSTRWHAELRLHQGKESLAQVVFWLVLVCEHWCQDNVDGSMVRTVDVQLIAARALVIWLERPVLLILRLASLLLIVNLHLNFDQLLAQDHAQLIQRLFQLPWPDLWSCIVFRKTWL